MQGGFFNITTLGCSGRVDVDRYQCFGWVNHNCATRWEANFALECRLDLTFNLEAIKHRCFVLVEFDFVTKGRHHLLNQIFHFVEHFFAVDQDFTDVLTQMVTNRTDDDVGFLIDQKWSDTG